jgi:acetolactate synthase small subunit
MLRNKLTNQMKSSCDKVHQVHGAKRNIHISGINRSVTKAEISEPKEAKDDATRHIKSTESRGADSNPAKKTHTLTKQDSSRYLKGNSQDKILKRTQRTAS